MDFSCESFFLVVLLFGAWLMWGVIDTAKDVAGAAKKLAENETVREAGGQALGSWLGSWFD
jgi:hypothetical protein